MDTSKIICVKVSQKLLRRGRGRHPYQWFPFERAYLAPVEMYPTVSKMFRYYFHMELNSELLAALYDLEVAYTREVPLGRNDEVSAAKSNGGEMGMLTPLIGDNPKKWTLIVPTHITGKYKPDKDRSILEASRVMYIFSRAIRGGQSGRNDRVNMPRIALHTPQKEIPVMCTVCERLPDFHNDECAPGRGSCAPKAKIELSPDDHFRMNRNKVMRGEP